MEYTEYYSLKKPGSEDFYSIADFNENADIIDEQLSVGETAYEKVMNLLSTVTSIESSIAKLNTKTEIYLVVWAPSGTAVTLTKGSAKHTFTVGAQQYVSRLMATLGDWELTYTYKGVSYGSRTVSIESTGTHRIAAAPTLEASPWEFIDKMSQMGMAEDCWKIGDTKSITVGSESATVRILDFDKDVVKATGKRRCITFGLTDVLASYYKMDTSSAAVEWADRELITTTLPALKNKLDSSLQTAIKPVEKIFMKPDTVGDRCDGWTSKSGGEALDAELFIPSEVELFGHARGGNPYFLYGEQYEYYKRGNSFVASGSYWLRAQNHTYTQPMVRTIRLNTDGTLNFELNTSSDTKLLFMFCV